MEPHDTVTVAVAVAVASLGAGLAVLGLLGVVSWRRTGPVRRGDLDREPRVRGGPAVAEPWGSTSMVTLVPAAVGSCWVGGALAGSIAAFARGRSPPIGAVLVGAIGLGVAASGFVARVTRFEALPAGFVVRHTGRPPFVAPWDRVVRLSPPRWFMGAWTLCVAPTDQADPGVELAWCRLMPSDLWNHEAVLVAVVRESGLRRRGRGWIRLEASSGAPQARAPDREAM